MGGHSHSKSSSTQNTTTYNLAADGDNSGVMIGGNNNTVTTTDYGAIKAAGNIASDAFKNNREAIESAGKVANQALKSNQAAMDDVLESEDKAFDFGTDMFKRTADNYNASLQQLSSVQAAQTNSNNEAMAMLSQFAQSQATGGGTELVASMKQIVIVLAILVAVTLIFIAWRRTK